DDQPSSVNVFQYPSWRLARVCQRWRGAAVGLPALWADIRFSDEYVKTGDAETAMEKEEYFLFLVATQLQRSQNYPLSVNLKLSTHSSRILERLLTTVLPSSHRWRNLSITCSELQAFDRLTPLKDSLGSLETLFLWCGDVSLGLNSDWGSSIIFANM